MEQQAVLTSLVKAQDRKSVREKLRGIEDITLLQIADCSGQPECHEILPLRLLLNGHTLNLAFLNLTHNLNETYKVFF